MKRALLSCAVIFLAMLLGNAQSFQFKPGEYFVDDAGRATYSTNPSLLNVIKPMVYMNLVQRESAGEKELFVVLSTPVKVLSKVSEGSSLTMDFETGGSMTLPLEEEVQWDEGLVGEKKKTEIYLINIPYKITEEQIKRLTNDNVRKVTMNNNGGEDLSFSPKGSLVLNISQRHYKNLLAMSGAEAPKKNNDNYTSPNLKKGSPQAKYAIHETPDTKTFPVNSLKDLRLFPVSEGHFIVLETKTHDAYIFNTKGDNTGRIRLSERNPGFNPPASIGDFNTGVIFSGGKAFAVLEDQTLAIFDTSGKVIKILDFLDSNNADYMFRDGVAVVPFISGRDYLGFLTYHYKYINEQGDIIYPDLVFTLSYHDDSMDNNVRPLCDDRRLHCTREEVGFSVKLLYGYLDKTGRIVIPSKFSGARDFSEGLAAVSTYNGEKELWGYIDPQGKWVIEPMFSTRPGDFHDGFACVKKKNGTYVYIDKTGKVCSDEYLFASRFFEGKAFVSLKDADGAGNRVIDKSFSVIQPTTIRVDDSNLYCAKTGTIYSGKHKTIGCIFSSSGEFLMNDVGPFISDYTYYESYAPSGGVAKGYVNLKGEVILKFVENEF